MAAWLSQRSTILSTFSATAINYSTLSGSAITLNSTMISLGTSTNSVYTRLSQGNFNSSVSTSSWVSSLINRVSTTTVAMSANAQYQLALSQSSISTSVMFTSTLGSSWSTLSGVTGLPNYSTIRYTAGAVSGTGQYGVLGAYGGYLYTTSTFGSNWTNTNPNIPRIYLPFENSITDSQGNSNVTTLVTPVYVPGIIGNNAINIANTTTGTTAIATQYVRGTWANNLSLTSYTVSFWFNQKSNSGQQYVFSAFNSVLSVQINNNGHLNATIPTAASPFYTSFIIAVLQTIMLNTWYNITLIYQSTGVCYLYLNNTLYGTVTGAGIYAAGNSGIFSLGTMDNSGDYAFNGYIDDLKIYNSAITFTPMVPQNWSSTAVSNSGQYMLATATGAGLYMSSNFGSTWSQVTGALLNALWSNTQISATGQYMLVNAAPVIVQPQLSGLASNSWQVNGITWTASASISNTPTQGPFNAFSGSYSVAWVGALGAYRNGSPFNYTAGTYSTNIQGIGTIGGDWLQIQSSVPIVMYSYTWASSGFLQMPKNYYIIGSNDTVNWYPIQNVVGVTNPLNTYNTACTSYIIVNNTSTQTVQGNIAGSFTTTAYSTSSNAYIYFRLVVTNVWGYENGNVNVGQWFINFQAGGQTYSTNYGATWSNYMPLYTTIQPQLSGIASSTTALTTAAWQTNGVTWIAKASSLQASNPGTWPVSFAFDNTAFQQWNSVDGYDSSGNPTIAPIKQTIVSGSTINGEWLQLESSTPLVMNSYKIGSGGSWQYPKSYTIAGSNDNGSTWFIIQTVTFVSNPSGASNQLIPSTLIVVAQSGIQTVVTSAATANATCIPGANSTTAFTYFRIIAQSIFGNGSNSCLSIGDWFINFVGGTLSTQALSESGQYQLTANATASPILLGQLNFENTYVDTAPTPTLTYVGNQGYNSGSNISLSNVQAKVGSNSLYSANIAGATTNLSCANYTLSSFFNGATAYTISTWLYPAALPASSAAVPYHLTNSTFVVGAYPYINTAGIIRLAFYTTTSGAVALDIPTTTIIPINTWTHLVIMFASGIASIYINGILSGTGVYTGTICLANNGGAPTNLLVGSATNAYGGYNGFIDDVRIYNAGLTSTQIYTLYATTALTPAIYITQNFSTGVPLIPTITPALNASTNVPVASAVSNTGQYMLFITNNTSGNNVYYSMNYGSTFTGLQLGTAQLTSCAISYDGSYITIASGATVYTLNNNSTGFSLAIGNQAGAQNQANNAIAIGNYAGYQNQTANSIILNASGQSLNAITQGFYVSPISSYTASSAQTISLLGYGTDNQVVQTALMSASGNLTVPLGNLGIGTNAPGWALHVEGVIPMSGISGRWGQLNQYMPAQLVINNLPMGQRLYIGSYYTGGGGQISVLQSSGIWDGTDHPTGISINPNGGNVGIGTINLASVVHFVIPSTTPVGQGNVFTIATGGGSSNSQRLYIGNYDTGSVPGSASYTFINASYYGYAYNNICLQTEGGRVGIGKTNPSQLLDVNGAINCTSFLVNGTAVATGTGSVWGVNGSSAYYTSGNVGIGTISPGTTLQLYGSGGAVNQFIINTTTSGYSQIWLISGGNAGSVGGGLFMNGPTRSVDGGVNTLTLRNDAGDLILATPSNSPSIYLKAATGVGIGTTSPSATLELVGSGGAGAPLRLVSNSAGAEVGIGWYRNPDRSAPTIGDMWVTGLAAFGVGDRNFGIGCNTTGHIMTLLVNGNVGIGLTNPSAKFHVNGGNMQGPATFSSWANCLSVSAAAGVTGVGIGYNTTTDTGQLFSISPGIVWKPMTYYASAHYLIGGNVGIGTTSPTSTLQVNGSLAKTSGTFDIAHPLHPTTKRLVHSFIEGPRCDLIYRGTIALTNGVATVDINRQCTHNEVGAMEHGTFEALCANPDVFLQNRTGFSRVIGTIQGGILTITCENNTATDLISWMVVAERADSFIKQWDRTDDDGFLITEYSQ